MKYEMKIAFGAHRHSVNIILIFRDGDVVRAFANNSYGVENNQIAKIISCPSKILELQPFDYDRANEYQYLYETAILLATHNEL